MTPTLAVTMLILIIVMLQRTRWTRETTTPETTGFVACPAAM